MSTRVLIVLALVFLPLAGVNAATMSIAPSATSVTAGDIVTARIVVNAGGVAINNAEAVISFPSDILSVLSVNKSSSIFTLWVTEPNFSNGAGSISYNGGLPSPGYSGSNGTVITVTFTAKKAGTATLSFSDAAVRANDGLGTNVLSGSAGTQITVTAPAVVAPVAPVTPVAPTPAAEAPAAASKGSVELSSPTHPSETAWYASPTPTLTWSLPNGADAVQVIADSDADTAPSVTYRPPIVEKTVSALGDGVWYFNLRYRVAGTWSAVSSYRLNIDSTAPVLENTSFTYDEITRMLRIAAIAEDELSGIASYEVVIDDKKSVVVPGSDFEDGFHELAVTESGPHTVTLRALDAAGNSAEAKGTFTVATSVMDTPVFQVGDFTIRLLPLLILMGLISLLSLLAAVTAGILAYRHLAGPHRDRAETRKKVHRAFTLLRTDLDKQIRALHKVKTGKELSEREELLSTKLSENISDLEQYLYEETDILK